MVNDKNKEKNNDHSQVQTNVSDVHATINPILQAILIILSIATMRFIETVRLNKFHVREKMPEISFVSPQEFKQFGTFQTDITIGLFINQFEKFDMVNNDFVFTGILWFKLNPGAISLDVLDNFIFERGKILEKSEADTQLVDGKLLVQYPLRVAFNSLLNYTDFPLDDHRLYLTVINRFLSPEEVLFNSSKRSFIIKQDVTTFGWKKINNYVVTGYKKMKLDLYNAQQTLYYPAAIFVIDYERYGERFSLSIFLPLLLIFYLTLFAFSFRSAYRIISITTGGITAILAYRFVIENLSPKTGYFMISDAVFLLLLGVICVFFLINIIDLYAIHLHIWLKRIMLVFIHIFVCAAIFYLFFY